MKKLILKVRIADDDTCKGCPYLQTTEKEVFYQQYETSTKCRIFNCEITNFQRCVACKSCEVSE